VTRQLDAIIVGAGQAGPSLAGRLTDAGQTVAVVERKLIGATCVNSGCIPTKTLVASAQSQTCPSRGTRPASGNGVGEHLQHVRRDDPRSVATSRRVSAAKADPKSW
jgi:pyruvate/2-oxoglutarate dehydrogenase complex dihydrolipoamide dehydrogenase (E3) component